MTPRKCIKTYQTLKICISRQSMALLWFDSWKTLENHFISICWLLVKVFDSGMSFVSHQNFCFASLAETASPCSSDRLPKSVRATLMQLGLGCLPRPACPVTYDYCGILLSLQEHQMLIQVSKILSQLASADQFIAIISLAWYDWNTVERSVKPSFTSENIWAGQWENVSYVICKQQRHPHSLISAFIVRCLDSIISLDSIAEISRL